MNSTTSQAEKPKSGRSATSCLECQRRKQKCSREWPCNHCQARKVPHLCQFATRKVTTPESDAATGPARLGKRRKEDSFESDSPPLGDDPDHDLSDGLAKLGYMSGHEFFALAKSGGDSFHGRNIDGAPVQSAEVETALKTILPKPYTDVLVQNFLENANYQYYAIFPEQLRGQSIKWWETRAAGQRLSPELTCLLLRVCAASAQYLEESLRLRLELELGEKAQSMTERFHAAAQRLSSSIPRGAGGVVQVQQLFLEASWWKSEAHMIESWHSLSVAIREAQEIGMHKRNENLPNFERELRKRLWCILWTWDWQMSTLLSRPLLIDQDDHDLDIPDGRLENITDPEVPHPLSSVALQATLGLHVSHLFQKLSTDNSLKLVLDIEDALEKWMGTFPAALRDHRPDTRWDARYLYVPFMRCQVNVIAYCYLLAPLKPYLLGTADPAVMSTQLGTGLKAKGVDTCLDLMRAGEKFYDLVFPQSIKYFFIIFFLFDAATVMCSAIVHDVDHTLPKRNQCLRSLRTAQELMDDVAHLSESARISAQLLRKLTATLPLAPAEKQVLGVGQQGQSPVSAAAAAAAAPVKKIRTDAAGRPDVVQPDAFQGSSSAGGGGIHNAAVLGAEYGFANNSTAAAAATPASMSTSSTRTNSVPGTMSSTPYDMHPPGHAYPHPHQQQPPSYAQSQQQSYDPMPMPPNNTGGVGAGTAADWAIVDYGMAAGMAPVPSGAVGGGGGFVGSVPVTGEAGLGGVSQPTMGLPQLGDPLTGTYLDQLWDWDRLNMDLSGYSMPQYGP